MGDTTARTKETPRIALLTRLARDRRGNTLAIMAISMIPLAALGGSAIDTARVYVVKTRLQQACDAGVLAGRKFMANSDSPALDATAVARANAFFANNFKGGYMMTGTAAFTPTKTADRQVAGTARVTVPMTIMTMFMADAVTLEVSCEARFDVADADVMFVLDTTGSMACTSANFCTGQTASYTRPDGTTGFYAVEQQGSKLSGLRSAVLSFYDTLTSNIDPSTQVRYGFVTYTSTVNAGYAITALSPDYMVTRWDYQSRQPNPTTPDVDNGDATSQTFNNTSQATCNTYAGRSPAVWYTTTGTATRTTVAWSNRSNGRCVVTSQPLKPNWYYTQVNYDVRDFVKGNAVIDPSKVTGVRTKWQGCIEERNTTTGSSFDPANLPPDLDPDLIPTNDDTRWRPMWPEVTYYRGTGNSAVTNGVTYVGSGTNPYGDFVPGSNTEPGTAFTHLTPYAGNGWDGNIRWGYVACGKPVQRLQTMSRSDVSNYVNASDFKAQGGTYHDTGMIWGTRMISPTGPFAAHTAKGTGRSEPNRYIVFMTDGDMAPDYDPYGMYGIERYDQRVTGGNSSVQRANHNARFLAECAAAKARNISVFVVGFGQTLTTQLTKCASPGQAYYASDNAGLTTAFQTIANQVAMLRISK